LSTCWAGGGKKPGDKRIAKSHHEGRKRKEDLVAPAEAGRTERSVGGK